MNRRPPRPTLQTIPQWQTIYCSLMLLLVVFFIMLIAYSAIDKTRLLQIKQQQSSAAPALPPQSPDIDQAMQSLRQLGMAGGIGNDLSVVRTPEGFKAVVPNPVLFTSGEASLDAGIYPILDGIIRIAEREQLSIQVEGHTDNLPIHTERFPSNWELSTMRAVNILRYLQRNGIPSGRLSAVGFAEYRPVAGNDSPEGRQKNRRIEILFRASS